MGLQLKNRASGTLASSINNTVTSIALTAGHGARFPSLGVGDWFPGVLVDGSGNYEVVRVTARATDVLTVVRGQEGTSGRSWNAGATFELRLTQAAIQQIIDDAANATAAVSSLVTTLQGIDYLTKSASGSLSGERVVTDTARIAWDWATAGQAKADVVDGSINFAKLLAATQPALIGAEAAGAFKEITLGKNVALASGALIGPTPMPGFSGLAIKVTSNTQATVTANYVTMIDGNGDTRTLPVNATLNMATTGANALDTGAVAQATWYYVFAIAKSDGTVAVLASTSATAPTLPSGYTYKARIGALRTAQSVAQLMGTYQYGNRAYYLVGVAQTTVPPLIVGGAAGTWSDTSPTLVAVSIANFVPPTAATIVVSANSAANMLVAPNTSYGGNNNGPLGSNLMVYPIWIRAGAAGEPVGMSAEMPVTPAFTLGYVADAIAPVRVSCFGWTDNL